MIDRKELNESPGLAYPMRACVIPITLELRTPYWDANEHGHAFDAVIHVVGVPSDLHTLLYTVGVLGQKKEEKIMTHYQKFHHDIYLFVCRNT